MHVKNTTGDRVTTKQIPGSINTKSRYVEPRWGSPLNGLVYPANQNRHLESVNGNVLIYKYKLCVKEDAARKYK